MHAYVSNQSIRRSRLLGMGTHRTVHDFMARPCEKKITTSFFRDLRTHDSSTFRFFVLAAIALAFECDLVLYFAKRIVIIRMVLAAAECEL